MFLARVLTQNELLSRVRTLLDPGTGEARAASPSAYHRGCWHRHASTLRRALHRARAWGGPAGTGCDVALRALPGPVGFSYVLWTHFHRRESEELDSWAKHTAQA